MFKKFLLLLVELIAMSYSPSLIAAAQASLTMHDGPYDSDGFFPLFRAAMDGKDDEVKRLIDSGANVNQARKNGATPLYMACYKGYLDIARLLLQHGASGSINQPSIHGYTPLCVASEKGHREIVKLLLQHGANVNQASKNGATPLYVASQNGHLEIASEKGHLDIVKLLIAKGAHVNQPMKDGATPFYIACQSGHLDIARFLLSAHADLDVLYHSSIDNKNYKALDYALFENNQPLIDFLESAYKDTMRAWQPGENPENNECPVCLEPFSIAPIVLHAPLNSAKTDVLENKHFCCISCTEKLQEMGLLTQCSICATPLPAESIKKQIQWHKQIQEEQNQEGNKEKRCIIL